MTLNLELVTEAYLYIMGALYFWQWGSEFRLLRKLYIPSEKNVSPTTAKVTDFVLAGFWPLFLLVVYIDILLKQVLAYRK